MQYMGAKMWEIALPAGSYNVHIVAGDPTVSSDVYNILAEGQTVLDGRPTAGSYFVEGTVTVSVIDGRLTLSNGTHATNNKICYVDIQGTTAVTPVINSLTITPPSAKVLTSTMQQFTAAAFDQFGRQIAPPPKFSWSVKGTGVIDSLGRYTAGAKDAVDTVVAGVSAGTAVLTKDAIVIVTSGQNPGALLVKINFQQSYALAPVGYLIDDGLLYGDKGNGYFYGWTPTRSYINSRKGQTDQRLADFAIMQYMGARMWEIALPAGSYNIHIVAGDPTVSSDVYNILAEGQTVLDGRPAAGSYFVEGTVTVSVSDGRLTLSNGIHATNNKICYVDIQGPLLGKRAANPLVQASILQANMSTGRNRVTLPVGTCVYNIMGKLVRTVREDGQTTMIMSSAARGCGLYVIKLPIPGKSTVRLPILR
jgi:hypothetical protein